MDSEVQRDGRILDLIDDAWREDKLPYEDVAIPLSHLMMAYSHIQMTASEKEASPTTSRKKGLAVDIKIPGDGIGSDHIEKTNELPEPEQDNGGTTESVKEQEMKWTDLALQYLHENVPPTGN